MVITANMLISTGFKGLWEAAKKTGVLKYGKEYVVDKFFELPLEEYKSLQEFGENFTENLEQLNKYKDLNNEPYFEDPISQYWLQVHMAELSNDLHLDVEKLLEDMGRFNNSNDFENFDFSKCKGEKRVAYSKIIKKEEKK